MFHNSRLLLALTPPGLWGGAAGSLRGSSQGCALRHRGLRSARPGSREARSSSPNSAASCCKAASSSRTFSPIEDKAFLLASRLSLQLLASPSSSLALCLQRKPSSSARFSLLPHSGHRYVEGDSREAGQHHPGTTQDLQTKLSPIRQKKLI